MTRNNLLFLAAAAFAFVAAVQALDCWEYYPDTENANLTDIDGKSNFDLFPTMARLVGPCDSCKKAIINNTDSETGLRSVQEYWYCLRPKMIDNRPIYFGCNNDISINYATGGVNDSRICACCTTGCNNKDFCTELSTKNLQKVRAMADQYKTRPVSTPVVACRTGGGGGMFAKAKPFTVVPTCQACMRRRNLILMGGGQRQDVSQCTPAAFSSLADFWALLQSDDAKPLCIPYVQARISGEGNAFVCTCCEDNCSSDDSFCDLSAPIPGFNETTGQRTSPRQNTDGGALGAQGDEK